MANYFLQFATTILIIFSHSIGMAKAATNEVDTLVLDVEGNPLEVGSYYYVRTELSKAGIGGGLVATPKPNHPECPLYVAQLAAGWYRESPIMFLPSDPSQKHIHISSDLNIIFNTSSSVCSQRAWQLTPDANNGKLYLSTGDDIENPSPQTAANWFKLEKSFVDSSNYQLEYCPSSSSIDAFARNELVCGFIDNISDLDEFSEDNPVLYLGLSPRSPEFLHILSFIKA